MAFNVFTTTMGGSEPHPHLNSGRKDNGPNELADVVLFQLQTDYIGFNEDWFFEEGLRKLISVAFFASLSADEGRYPCCSLHWSGRHEWFQLCTFGEKKPLATETLRRLAPVCQLTRSAIQVVSRKNEHDLCLEGLTTTRFDGVDLFPGRPEFVSLGREPNIQVHIIAPGHLRVDCGIEIELRAGELRTCQATLVSLACVKALSQEFDACVRNEVVSRCKLNHEQSKLFGGLPSRLDKLLEIVLRTILDRGHGGTLIVIPDRELLSMDEQNKERMLSVANTVDDLNLTEKAIEFLASCVEFNDPSEPQSLPDRCRKWHQCRGRLTLTAKTIGELASVDGCVVVDRNLSVVGFGCKIDVSREAAQASPITYVSYNSQNQIVLDELERHGGTRLRSALWLCKCYADAIAFVVSQDHHVKVLWSEKNTQRAFAFKNVTIPTIPQLS